MFIKCRVTNLSKMFSLSETHSISSKLPQLCFIFKFYKHAKSPPDGVTSPMRLCSWNLASLDLLKSTSSEAPLGNVSNHFFGGL